MRLSEALVLAAVQYPVNANSWTCGDGGCLLHIAGKACGQEVLSDEAAERIWPFLAEEVATPEFAIQLPRLSWRQLQGIAWNASIRKWGKAPVGVIIQALAFHVADGNISIERVADWVRSIEPEETNDQGTGGTESNRVVSPRTEARAETLAESER